MKCIANCQQLQIVDMQLFFFFFFFFICSISPYNNWINSRVGFPRVILTIMIYYIVLYIYVYNSFTLIIRFYNDYVNIIFNIMEDMEVFFVTNINTRRYTFHSHIHTVICIIIYYIYLYLCAYLLCLNMWADYCANKP